MRLKVISRCPVRQVRSLLMLNTCWYPLSLQLGYSRHEDLLDVDAYEMRLVQRVVPVEDLEACDTLTWAKG